MKTADYSWDLTDPNTIELNRLGQLTPRQRELLHRHTPWPIFGCVIYLFLLGLTTAPFWWPGGEKLPSFMLPLYILIFGSGSLLVVAYCLYYSWRAYVDRQDVRQGKIVGAHGEVTKTSRGYMAWAQGVKLRTLVQKVDLLPGRYFFYYFPRSRYLLSAESLEANDILGAVELRNDLGQQFHFNEHDLMLNRSGRLSDRQRLKLLFQAAGFGILLLILITIGPLLIYGILQNEEFGLFSIQTAGLVLLFLVFLGWVGWAFLPRVVEALLGENKIIVGVVTLQYRGSGRSSRLYYIVNNLELQVGFNDYYNLVEGLVYQVHYTRWSKRIVSIEPV